MKPRSVRDTAFYGRAHNELNYPFGDFFLFDSYIIAEIHEEVLFNWEEHGKKLTEDLSNLYENDGRDIVYISNRIHSYNVMPADWIKFFRNSYKLKGYAIVSYSRASYLNALLEKLFVPARFKRFRSLDWAIRWATELSSASILKV
ncbi:MAG: hypothetical protein AAF361_15430 [Bacteroidota bacterium]